MSKTYEKDSLRKEILFSDGDRENFNSIQLNSHFSLDSNFLNQYYEELNLPFNSERVKYLSLKLRVRIEILNYFNDDRPLVIHSFEVRNINKSSEKMLYTPCGAPFQGNPKAGEIDKSFSNIVTIPSFEPYKIYSTGLDKNFSYLDNNKFLRITNEKAYMIDLIFTLEKSKHEIICTNQVCEACDEIKVAEIYNESTMIYIKYDKPDYKSNTGMLFKQVELLKL